MELKIRCQGSTFVKLDEIHVLQGNLKSLSKNNYEKFKKQLLELGFSAPFHVWVNDNKKWLVDGTQRFRTISQMRDEGVVVPDLFPAVLVDADDVKEAKKKILALASQYGEIDKQGLYEFLETADIDLDDIMDDMVIPNVDWDDFRAEFFDEPPVPNPKDDAVPDTAQNEMGVELGQIWQLGNHRLMCGDSTDKECVERLMNGENADITFTSPPYNVGDSTRGQLYKNDTDNKSDYVGFLGKFTDLALENSRFVFVNIQALSANWRDVFEYQHRYIDRLKDVLIWNKKQCPPNIQKGSFNTKFEFVYAFTSEKSNGRNFPCEWQGMYPNVVETESNSGNEFAGDHKAGFPVAFPTWFIEKMDFAKLVYEPFCGTGTTLIAAEKTGRRCIAMEIDPHYVSVAIKRWQEHTGKKARLLE